jgi:hypothetical protein
VEDESDPSRTLHGTGMPTVGQPPQQPQQQPFPPPPQMAAAVVAPRTSAPAETYSRHFIGISLKRAFRLDIRADEVLPTERAMLETQAAHITNPEQQAFLAWRRSVLLMVALMFVPLTVSRFIEAFDGLTIHRVARIFTLLPAIAEGLFAIVAFDQLRKWTQWKRQRRVLFIAWIIYFLAPFVVYLYPWRTAFDLASYKEKLAAMKLGDAQFAYYTPFAIGLKFGALALVGLGPKIISLMPGLVRASIVAKLQFPGTTTPGWLIMLAAPLYALFAYIIVLLPYQVTGSWQFLVGNAGVLIAQVFIGVAGHRLTVPLSNQEAYHRIHKTWLAYIAILVVSLLFMVYGFYDFIHELHLGVMRVITSVLAIVSNVLLDTLIGTDLILAAMVYFRQRGGGPPDPARVQLLQDAEKKLDEFAR